MNEEYGMDNKTAAAYFADREITLDELELLSPRAYNLLMVNGKTAMADIAGMTQEDLMALRGMDAATAREIVRECGAYIEKNRPEIEAFAEYLAAKAAAEAETDEETVEKNAECAFVAEAEGEEACMGEAAETEGTETDGPEETCSALEESAETEGTAVFGEEGRIVPENVQLKELGFSVRTYNCLMRSGRTTLADVLSASEEDLYAIRNMGKLSVNEVIEFQKAYFSGNADVLKNTQKVEPCLEMFSGEEAETDNNISRDVILDYVQNHNIPVEKLNFSNRTSNGLIRNGELFLSNILFLGEEELMRIRNLGRKSVEEVLAFQRAYLPQITARAKAEFSGDISLMYDDETLRDEILRQFNGIGFGGLKYEEIRSGLGLTEQFDDGRLKALIGGLIAEGKLEYTDYRCYRVYPSFMECVEECPVIDERQKRILHGRMSGKTLEECGVEENVRRERIRQIVVKAVEKVRKWHANEHCTEFFDEDYYRALFETYAIDKKDAAEWLGIPEHVFRYLETCKVEKGKEPIEKAVEDRERLEAGLRLKVMNLLHKDCVYLDGRWIPKLRTELEEYVLRKYCRNEVGFDDFCETYNCFLEQEGVPFDGRIYLTEEVKATRKERLRESRCVLWKYKSRLRYYDIDGGDYEELLETLGLDGYKNTEISALKLVRDYPELMERYDIRDEYELYDLLHKTVDIGRYPDIDFSRMPILKFGTVDRELAVLELLIEHAPVEKEAFAGIVAETFGVEPATATADFTPLVKKYLVNGVYDINQKVMTAENRARFENALEGDFFFYSELRKIYASVVPNADLDEINPYNLSEMGFLLNGNYVVRNYPTATAFFEALFLGNERTDISSARKRYANVQLFVETLGRIRSSRRAIEYEPDRFIRKDKLEAAGCTDEAIRSYCDAVDEFVKDNCIFTVQSIWKAGFVHPLEELGFSAWFYANLLLTDGRFAFCRTMETVLLRKGSENVSLKALAQERILASGRIDVLDLVGELEKVYGCKKDRSDILEKLKETDVYYDAFSDRLYASEAMFDREVFGEE